MRKNINAQKIEGRLYDHKLEMKKVTNKNSAFYGLDFISGEIFIATDEEGLNVIPVHYTFVMPTFASGAKDSRFAAFEKITTEEKTWLKVGKENAENAASALEGSAGEYEGIIDSSTDIVSDTQQSIQSLKSDLSGIF